MREPEEGGSRRKAGGWQDEWEIRGKGCKNRKYVGGCVVSIKEGKAFRMLLHSVQQALYCVNRAF